MGWSQKLSGGPRWAGGNQPCAVRSPPAAGASPTYCRWPPHVLDCGRAHRLGSMRARQAAHAHVVALWLWGQCKTHLCDDQSIMNTGSPSLDTLLLRYSSKAERENLEAFAGASITGSTCACH